VEPFLYLCPNTGYRVQSFIAEDVSDEFEGYRAITCLACRQIHAITCLACRQIHLVNPTTGKVLGDDDE
jgi:hypothetical protein